MRKSADRNVNATSKQDSGTRGLVARFVRWALVGTLLCSFAGGGGSGVAVSADETPRSLRGGGGDDGNGNGNNPPALSSRPLRILTLGGSVTWGATLSSRQWAYPFLIGSMGSHVVHNLAIRATDAYFPSLCVQSMLIEAKIDHVEFDVIVLEYSINGFNGITTLIKRLQYRYPDAVFVYVHLVSLKLLAERPSSSDAEDGGGRQGDEVSSWRWKPNRRDELFEPKPKFKELLDRIGAYLYYLPKRHDSDWLVDDVSFYASDGHHLSERGHMRVAKDLVRVLSNYRDPRLQQQQQQQGNNSPATATTTTNTLPQHQHLLRTWGEGDSCSDWLLSARLSNPHVLRVDIRQNNNKNDDARNNNGDVAPVMRQMISRMGNPTGKFSLEFDTAGTVTVKNHRRHPVAVYVSFMAGSVGGLDDPRRYPLTMLTLNDDEPVPVEPSARDEGTIQQGFDVNPNHVRATIELGVARPGDNTIRIEPVRPPRDDGDDNGAVRELPFRLVGVALYGFKYNVGLPIRTAQYSLRDGEEGRI